MLAIFLDIETTGLDPLKHHSIDLALKIVDINEGVLKASYQSLVNIPLEMWNLRDPVSMEINGLTWEQILTGKESTVIRQEIIELFTQWNVERGKAVFICQNPSFDRGFFSQLVDVYTQERLLWPYHWLDLASMYWTILTIKSSQTGGFPQQINLSKNEIAKLYQISPEVLPHCAMRGVEHLIQCYQAVLSVSFTF